MFGKKDSYNSIIENNIRVIVIFCTYYNYLIQRAFWYLFSSGLDSERIAVIIVAYVCQCIVQFRSNFKMWKFYIETSSTVPISVAISRTRIILIITVCELIWFLLVNVIYITKIVTRIIILFENILITDQEQHFLPFNRCRKLQVRDTAIILAAKKHDESDRWRESILRAPYAKRSVDKHVVTPIVR